MDLLLGFSAFVSTLLGGVFALRKQDKLHLILGFSAGAVIGVSFFDLMPEAFGLASNQYSFATIANVIAGGFLLFMLLSRMILLHPHSSDGDHCENTHHQGPLGAASLSIHSFLDGVGIGLAFQVSASVGAIVAVAVLVHDFSDGINTVSFILKSSGNSKSAYRWLWVDAAAPVLGVLATRCFRLQATHLGLVLALFCGFFLYIGASDLVPESHHRHPTFMTSVMTIIGTATIFIAIHFASL